MKRQGQDPYSASDIAPSELDTVVAILFQTVDTPLHKMQCICRQDRQRRCGYLPEPTGKHYIFRLLTTVLLTAKVFATML